MSQMGRLEFATPKEAWGGEATDFTPLLGGAEMLEYLGDTTGIGPLIPVEIEHTTAGNRSLDILAETVDGQRVAIENQYREADHDHLTRGLAYAVASESVALIVIAENHRDEFVSVADYLNEIAGQATPEGIQVWLVNVRAVRRVGDTIWSPEFVVKAEPNEWEAAVRRETSPVLASLEDFYNKCEAVTDGEWADTARGILDDWLGRRGAKEFHGNKATVSLYYPSPKQGDGGINVMQLDTKGTFYVCRGYIWEMSGVFDPDEEPASLDSAIRGTFPDAIWAGKQRFPKVPGVKIDDFSRFADWLTDHFDKSL